MNTHQLSLSKNHLKYFERFLLESTSKSLDVLENMFAIHIDNSDSSIEILPNVDIEKMEHLASNPLFVISSEISGELEGTLNLLMSSTDFENLGEVMKPILKLLFLSNPDADLATLEDQKPDWMHSTHPNDSTFISVILDTLTEMGNVLFGVYTIALYKVFDLNSHHSVPVILKDKEQQNIQQILSLPELANKQHLVIESEFSVLHKPIKLWCLISLSKKSFQDILDRVG